jgi:tRNA (cytidine/uridine-2'-O-)-methyltransferase
MHHSDLAHMTSDENEDKQAEAIDTKPTSHKALLNLVLYQPEIPQNTGNIGRTCVAIGAKLWLIRPLGFRVDDKSLKRAGMDYWEHLDWEVADSWEDVRKRLPDSQVWYLTKTATRLVWDATFQIGDILLFGSESRGLPASILSQHPASNLKLPMSDLVRSLNLASTANTVAYEAVRQLGGLKF